MDVISLMGQLPQLQQGAEPMAAVIPLQSEAAEEQQEQESSGCGPAELAGALVAMAAYANELRVQAGLIHVNIECANFLSVHEFLKAQYEAHTEQFDTLLELVRSLDYFAPVCSCGLAEAMSCDFEHVKTHDARHMLIAYYRNLEAYGAASKELVRLGREANAPDIENYGAELAGACYKSSWQIKATLRS